MGGTVEISHSCLLSITVQQCDSWRSICSAMGINQTMESVVSCDLTAPGPGVMRLVQLYFMPGIFLGVLALGLPLNLLSLYVFTRGLAQSNRSTLFLHNLALADTSWLLALPFLVQYHLAGMQWSLGATLCQVIRVLYHNYFYLSIFFVTCLSVDRYLAIVHPLRSPVLLSRQRAVKLCFAVWIFAIAISVPVAQMTHTTHCQSDNTTVCGIYVFMGNVKDTFPYSVLCSCLGFLLPFLLLSYCYICSVCQLRRLADPRLRGLAWELGAAMALFVLFYLPYHISRNVSIALAALLPEDLSGRTASDLAFSLEMCVCSLASCTNPMFSCLVGRTFRRELRAIFTRLWKRHRIEPEKERKKSRAGIFTVNEAEN